MDKDSWIDLLNSDWHDYRGSGRREDRLDDPAWLKRFLKPWKDELDGVPSSEIRAGLKNARRTVRGIVDRLAAGGDVPPALRAEVNSLLAASPSVRRLDRTPGGLALSLVPEEPGLGHVIGEIAAGFAEILARGERSRIKVCQNRDCLWVFYDRSKNRSRRWCEGGTGCGNLMKVRRFRAKRRRQPRRAGRDAG